MTSGTNKVIDLELEHLLGSERYFRFQVELPQECDLDDATPQNFRQLRKLATELVTTSGRALDQVCGLLTRS